MVSLALTLAVALALALTLMHARHTRPCIHGVAIDESTVIRLRRHKQSHGCCALRPYSLKPEGRRVTARTKTCVLRAHTVRHCACCRLLLTVPIRTRADLRCGGGGVLEERDDLPALAEPVAEDVLELRT